MIFPIFVFAQVEKVVPSKPKKVVVYPSGAQIESEVTFPLQKGQMKIVLPGLTSKLNQESIRIVSDNNYTILNVQYKVDYISEIDRDAETQKILNRINDLKFNIEDENTRIKIIDEKLEFLRTNKQVSGKNESISPVNFSELNQIYGSNIETLTLDKLKRERIIDNYNVELQKLNNQLKKVEANVGIPSGVIEVTIDAKNTNNGKMVFTYFVNEASWFPTYDIRFLGFNKPLEIKYFANIKQFTDIEWKNVEIVLSTAKTSVSAQIPMLQPYYLGYFYYKAPGRSVSAAISSTEGIAQTTSETTVRGNRGDGQTTIIDGVRVRSEDNESSYSVTPALVTNKEYIVDSPQTIPSSFNITTLTYGEGVLNATYDYQTIPKLGENVYLIAKIIDWNKAELNSGFTKLYLENSYVGKSFINTAQFKDTIEISFGVDNNISIKREKLFTFSEKTFTGSNTKESVAYKITVRNNKSYPVTTSVYDQIPISTDEKIVVDVIELTEGPLNKENGKVEWKLSLQPNETKTITIKYSVKYPKDKDVIVQ